MCVRRGGDVRGGASRKASAGRGDYFIRLNGRVVPFRGALTERRDYPPAPTAAPSGPTCGTPLTRGASPVPWPAEE